MTLENAKHALDYMIQKLRNDKLERKDSEEVCYNPIDWDLNPWQCPKQPAEDDVETTPSPTITSILLKSLK